MGDVTRADEDMLYQLFGVDAELLIDHAWGRECTTMADIKNYKPRNSSVSSGQVLARDYSFEECRLVVKEMVDALCLELTEKKLSTDSLSLMVGYSNELDLKHVGGSVTIPVCTNSYRTIVPHVLGLYERIVDADKPIRRLNLSCNRVQEGIYEQYELFTDYDKIEKDKKLQQAALDIKLRFGKNAVVRGMDLQDAGTTMERNQQIGGHKSGE